MTIAAPATTITATTLMPTTPTPTIYAFLRGVNSGDLSLLGKPFQ